MGLSVCRAGEKQMYVGSICNRDVAVVAKDASVLEAARAMREQHVGSLVVVEE